MKESAIRSTGTRWKTNFLYHCVEWLVNMAFFFFFKPHSSWFVLFTRLATTVGCVGRTVTVTNSGSSTSPQRSIRTACSTPRMTRTAGSIASPQEFSKSVSGEFGLNLHHPSAVTNVDVYLIDICSLVAGSSRVRAPTERSVLWPMARKSWRSGWTAENFFWWNLPKPEMITW